MCVSDTHGPPPILDAVAPLVAIQVAVPSDSSAATTASWFA